MSSNRHYSYVNLTSFTFSLLLSFCLPLMPLSLSLSLSSSYPDFQVCFLATFHVVLPLSHETQRPSRYLLGRCEMTKLTSFRFWWSTCMPTLVWVGQTKRNADSHLFVFMKQLARSTVQRTIEIERIQGTPGLSRRQTHNFRFSTGDGGPGWGKNLLI